MDEHHFLAEQFEEHRTHLRVVAYRMLGSLSEADDAVQEAWLRLTRPDTSGVENLGGWVTDTGYLTDDDRKEERYRKGTWRPSETCSGASKSATWEPTSRRAIARS